MLRPGLLDRRALRPPGLHVRTRWRARPFCFQDPGHAPHRGGLRAENEPSRNLLGKLGFREEGLARRYLLINGEWRDHMLFALLEDESRRAAGQARPLKAKR